MLHIKMFLSNAVFACHVQVLKATNSLTSVQHCKWAHSANSPASLLSTFRYPGKIENRLQIPCLAPFHYPGKFEHRLQVPCLAPVLLALKNLEFLTHCYDTFVDWQRLRSLEQMINGSQLFIIFNLSTLRMFFSFAVHPQ